jgi:hypothetical protein
MRNLLFNHLEDHFSGLVHALAADPLAVYQFKEPGQIVYDDVMQAKWIGTDRSHTYLTCIDYCADCIKSKS